MPDKTDSGKLLRKARYFGGAFLLFVFALAFIFQLGRFFIIIFSGLSMGMLFLTIYNYVLHVQANRPFRFAKPKKETKESKDLKAYIEFHLPLVISILLIGLLIALVVIFWVS